MGQQEPTGSQRLQFPPDFQQWSDEEKLDWLKKNLSPEQFQQLMMQLASRQTQQQEEEEPMDSSM